MNPIINTLPYDSQIEYLESSGTQYINTGISGGTKADYYIDVQPLSGSVNYAHICGSSQPATCPKIYIHTSNGWNIQYNNGSNTTSNVLSATDYLRHTIEYKDGKVYIDGALKVTTGTYGFGDGDFCVLSYTKESGLGLKGRLYSCKVWKDNVLVRDMIPVRVGSVGYMYDKVSGQLFGNAGTGSFTLGNDVYPSFAKGIGSVAHEFAVGDSEVQKMFLGETKIYDAVPYQKIEYLQNTSSSYINTGFVNTKNTEFVIDFQLTNSSGDRKIIGQGFKFGLGQMDGYWRIIDSQWYKTSSATDTNRHTARTENGAYYIDTTKIADRYSYKTAGTYNMLLFAVSSQNSVSPDGNRALMKLYSCKIYDNGSLVRDFIPVRVGSVGYLYDKVSKQLFGNAGSGSFTLGQDL